MGVVSFIYLTDGLPGMANQMWALSAVLAYALETGVRVRVPCFYRFHADFPALRSVAPCPSLLRSLRWVPGNEKLYRVGAAVVLWWLPSHAMDATRKVHLPPSEPWDDQSRAWQRAGSASAALVHGWMVRNPDGLVKHRRRLVELLSPRQAVLERARATVQRRRAAGCTVYGVHWRRGDYRHWDGGRYLLTEEDIARLLESAIERERSRGRVAAFFVASDEPVPAALLARFDITLSSSRTALDDLTTLSMCDEILGSSSTFGRWAAYAGAVPFRAVKPGCVVDWSWHETLEDLAGPRSSGDTRCRGWLP